MFWNKEKTDKHKKATRLLSKIKDEALQFLSGNPRTSELEVQKFILEKFKKYKLKNEVAKPIVAFRANTGHVHYYPTKATNKQLKTGSLILIDIWARLDQKNAPYADLTWMAFKQNQNSKTKNQNDGLKFETVETVFKARDNCLKFVEKEVKKERMPTGQEVDAVARKFLASRMSDFQGSDNLGKSDINKLFPHGTGHELGLDSPHGKGGPINTKNTKSLKVGMGYTIEPGVYFKNKFGVRSEIDFYISKNKKIVVTTAVQKKLSVI